MVAREWLGELYRHMEWADAMVWQAALTLPDPPDARLRLLLVHTHTVQQAFFRVWTGRPLENFFRQPEVFPTLRDVQAWATPYYAEAHAFLASVEPSRLATVVELPWSGQLSAALGKTPGPTTLGETAFQVSSHSTYHRGQINLRLRDLGVEPPLVDYIAWLWFGRPAAWWGS